MAVLVLLQLILGCCIGVLAADPQNRSLLHALLPVHLVMGTEIFALMVKRWQMRRRLGAPRPPVRTLPER